MKSFEELVQQPGTTPAGTAAVYYRIGTQPPVQVLTSCFQNTSEPDSLILWFYDPTFQPISFLMVLSISKIYIGPGEYKGNVNDVMVGMGVVSGDSQLTWTAGDNTASDVITYFDPGQPVMGTFTVQGLAPGPVFGPPDTPAPADQPDADIMFCFFNGPSM